MTINTLVIAAFFIITTISANPTLNPLAPKPSEVGCVRTSTGTDYVGSQNVSSSGRPCVRWDSLVGAFREHIKQLFLTMPERNAAKAQNFCRNPNSDQRGLWCFVSQLGTVQFCSVPKCSTFGTTTTSAATEAELEITAKRPRTNGRHLETSTKVTAAGSSNELIVAAAEDDEWSDSAENSPVYSKASEDRSDDMQNDPPSGPMPGSLYGDENDPYQTDSGRFAEEKEKANTDDWMLDDRPSLKARDGMVINFRDNSACSSLVPSFLLSVSLFFVLIL